MTCLLVLTQYTNVECDGGRRTLRIVPLMCQWTLGIVDDWGERASGCRRAGRRGVTTASTQSRVV